MTPHVNEVFKAILDHYDELLTLIETDSDWDVFQDTVLWVATHKQSGKGSFVRRFRTRFHFLRIESHSLPYSTLTHEVPDTSEIYQEETSDEYVNDVLKEIQDAILAEKEKALKGTRGQKKEG